MDDWGGCSSAGEGFDGHVAGMSDLEEESVWGGIRELGGLEE